MIEIIIPDRQHPSLNEWIRWHWAKRDRVKKTWETEITYKANKHQRPEFEQARVEILYYFPDERRRDLDNYVPKFI